MRSCIGLRKIVVDKSQKVQVNEGVIICILGKDDPMDEKVIEAAEEIYLPMKAPDGIEDTQQYHGLENVSIGEIGRKC